MAFRFGTIRTPVALLGSLLVFSACGEDTVAPGPLEVVRLTVGTQTVHFDTGGLRACCDAAGNPTLNTRITIAATGSVASRTQLAVVAFTDENGHRVEIDPATHELRLVPASAAITFTRLTSLSGNLFRATAGATNVTLTVVNTTSGQAIFGPFDFRICTVAATANATDCAS
jgi:hypothetical protein